MLPNSQKKRKNVADFKKKQKVMKYCQIRKKSVKCC